MEKTQHLRRIQTKIQIAREKNQLVLFVVPLNGYWLDCEFNMEHAMLRLPLMAQLKIRNRKLYHDRCLSLGNQLLQIFGTWMLLGTRRDVVVEPKIDDIIEGFSHNEHGKPVFTSPLKNDLFYSFNLSNDRELMLNSMVAVASTTTGNIGLDLINLNILSDKFVDELQNEILHPLELTTLKAQDNGQKRIQLFAQIWSLKESYSKYIGTGLPGLQLSKVEFRKLRLINDVDESNANIELYVDNEKVEGVTILTRLYRKDVYYSIVADQVLGDGVQVVDVDIEMMCEVLRGG